MIEQAHTLSQKVGNFSFEELSDRFNVAIVSQERKDIVSKNVGVGIRARQKSTRLVSF